MSAKTSVEPKVIYSCVVLKVFERFGMKTVRVAVDDVCGYGVDDSWTSEHEPMQRC